MAKFQATELLKLLNRYDPSGESYSQQKVAQYINSRQDYATIVADEEILDKNQKKVRVLGGFLIAQLYWGDSAYVHDFYVKRSPAEEMKDSLIAVTLIGSLLTYCQKKGLPAVDIALSKKAAAGESDVKKMLKNIGFKQDIDYIDYYGNLRENKKIQAILLADVLRKNP